MRPDLERHGAGAALSPQQLEQLRRALEAKRAELLRQTQENLSVSVVDEPLVENADLASRETITADSLGLADRQRELALEVEAALERMRLGTYGVSEVSGEPIPFPRLLAVPWARNDAHEEEALERRRS